MAKLFVQYLSITNEKKLPNSIKCTLGRFNIGQILNNLQEIAQRLQIVSPSGEISPNLVTLNELLQMQCEQTELF